MFGVFRLCFSSTSIQTERVPLLACFFPPCFFFHLFFSTLFFSTPFFSTIQRNTPSTISSSSSSSSSATTASLQDVRGHARLVLEYSTWIINYAPLLGLSIFVESDPIGAFVIHPTVVLKHILTQTNGSSSPTSSTSSTAATPSAPSAPSTAAATAAAAAATDYPPTTAYELCVAYLEYMLMGLPKRRAEDRYVFKQCNHSTLLWFLG